jgi:hypothetical protein
MGISTPKPKLKRLICNACDLNSKCNFYKNKSYRFAFGQGVSTHSPAIDAGYEERAYYCCHREKIPISEQLEEK